MGYYTGSGIVTEMSATINELTHLTYPIATGTASYTAQQRRYATITVKRGVEKPSSVTATATLNDKTLAYQWYDGSFHNATWLIPSCKGTKTDRQYTRIGDSNLFECREVEISLAFRYRAGTGSYSNWETS